MSGTPERQFGKELQNNVETPCTSNSIEYKFLNTNSPRRRNNLLKRRAYQELESPTKLLKRNENCSVSKARAALFQEKTNETNLRNITLSTKSFYSNSDEKKNHKINYELPEQKSQRRSLIGHTPCNKRSIRRHTIGGINAGVSHGIRRPKLRVHSVAAKNNVSDTIKNNTADSVKKKVTNSTDDLQEEQNVISIERSSSPEIDLSKRFFKFKGTSMRNGSSTVTINKNVKLKVAGSGEIILNKQNNRSIRQTHKRPKPVEISFDTTDLILDESGLDATMEQSDVVNILKMLEDDWADDDYDIMEALTNKKIDNNSSLKPVTVLQDDAGSSASELSNETSTVNITDVSISQTVENISLDDNENNVKENEERYYPIFNKGYSATKTLDDIDKKSTHNKKEGTNWQLSVKQNGDENQYQLDAGQKNFGATQCTECGIVYQIGDPEDENAHLNYHNNRKILKFSGWKTERIIMEDPITLSRVILIEPDDPKQYWNKVTDVLGYVDRDLGLVDTNLSDYENKKVYLYIRDKTILGVLVAEHINTAYRMIPELLELNCCTAESTPAKCGVNVVWTDMNHRRQGIATKLVDILRSQFYYGYIMSLDDIAFSIPTPSGKIFAEKYTKTRNFKVYS